MCSNYEPVLDYQDLKTFFDVEDALPPDKKIHTWPAYEAPFIRKHEHADVGDDAVPFRELLAGTFGMIPQWGDIKLARNTYNARSKTVHQKNSFRDAWNYGKHCEDLRAALRYRQADLHPDRACGWTSRLDTINKVLHSLGFKLTVQPIKTRHAVRKVGARSLLQLAHVQRLV